jgi:hypothetical protein
MTNIYTHTSINIGGGVPEAACDKKCTGAETAATRAQQIAQTRRLQGGGERDERDGEGEWDGEGGVEGERAVTGRAEEEEEEEEAADLKVGSLGLVTSSGERVRKFVNSSDERVRKFREASQLRRNAIMMARERRWRELEARERRWRGLEARPASNASARAYTSTGIQILKKKKITHTF